MTDCDSSAQEGNRAIASKFRRRVIALRDAQSVAAKSSTRLKPAGKMLLQPGHLMAGYFKMRWPCAKIEVHFSLGASCRQIASIGQR